MDDNDDGVENHADQVTEPDPQVCSGIYSSSYKDQVHLFTQVTNH